MSAKDDAYFLALGRFVDAFSMAEHNLKFALAAFAEIPRDVAQAIFSGTRTADAVAFIRRVSESRGKDISADLDAALTQMTVINGTRNEIVHYGASQYGTELMMTNAAHTIERQRRFVRFSVEDIDTMSADLAAISARFTLVLVESSLGAIPEAVRFLEKRAQVPLRYRPPQPIADRKEEGRTQARPKRVQKRSGRPST